MRAGVDFQGRRVFEYGKLIFLFAYYFMLLANHIEQLKKAGTNAQVQAVMYRDMVQAGILIAHQLFSNMLGIRDTGDLMPFFVLSWAANKALDMETLCAQKLTH